MRRHRPDRVSLIPVISFSWGVIVARTRRVSTGVCPGAVLPLEQFQENHSRERTQRTQRPVLALRSLHCNPSKSSRAAKIFHRHRSATDWESFARRRCGQPAAAGDSRAPLWLRLCRAVFFRGKLAAASLLKLPPESRACLPHLDSTVYSTSTCAL